MESDMKAITCFVLGVAILAIEGSAGAAILNPNFTDTSTVPRADGTYQPDFWQVDIMPDSDPTLASQDVITSNKVLQCIAHNTYNWNNGWRLSQGQQASWVRVSQGTTAPAGVTALSFRASAVYDGVTPGYYGTASVVNPVAVVSAIYQEIGATDSTTASLAIVDNDWSTLKTISLDNVDVLQPVEILIFTTSRVKPSEPQDSWPNTRDITVTAQFDDFQFVVPEPCTMFLLGCGAVALLRRRRA